MMRAKFFLFVLMLIAFAAINAQSPAPIIVQPANAAAAKSTSSTAAAAAVSSIPDAIKALEQVKAGNAEVLAKQKAALEKLDELQDAADQLRIFTKRG
jgi:3-deoxy-D-arabino-heptulosonate 7-phosphate (DAHP) synthase